MEVLFRSVRITDPNSPHHKQVRDVLIQNGVIADIKANIKVNKKIKELDVAGSCLSPGWIDVGCNSGEPGYEHRETLESLANAAVSGGYTSLCCFPNTKPVIHSKSEVSFLKNKSANLPVHIYPIGAVSKDCKSVDMAEMLQMKEAGAVAFSDGLISIQNSGVLMRALEYIKLMPDTLIINASKDQQLALLGQIHEGLTSTALGLRGIPSLSESTQVLRDLSILNYAGSRLMIHKVSTSDAVQHIKKEKAIHANLFASVSIFNLIFEDIHLENFNVNLKLDPPLRSGKDRKTLIKAITDGTIDIICSDHNPVNVEEKELEFQASAFGAISLETAYSAFNTYLHKELETETWIRAVSTRPAEILSLPDHRIETGNATDLSWFHPTMEWTYESNKIRSVSRNSPFVGQKLKGKVLGTFVKNKFNQA